jgi:hypothetical protein
MQGLTLRRIPPGHPSAGIPVVRLHYSADPDMTPERLAVLSARYTSEARRRRELEIEYEALEGELLYPQFHASRNVCPPANLSDPNYWTLWMALDPHPRTAHAMAYEAFNKYGDCIVCGEFWPEFGTKYGPTDGARYLTRDYAEAIQLFESDSKNKPVPFEWARGRKLSVAGRRFMDTFGKATYSDEGQGEDYFDSYLRLGNELKINLNFRPALKGSDNLGKAYDSIARKLMPSQGDGPPRMRVFETCIETIDEFENVRFPEGEAESARDEKPISYQKHALDCLAYIETARPGFIELRPQREQRIPICEATGW